MMLERVRFFLVHSFVHVFLYVLPRWVYTLLVKLPVTVYEWLIRRRPFTFSRTAERHITVITAKSDPAFSERLMHQCGMTHDMVYRGPLYNGDIQTVLGNLIPSHRVAYERELVEGFDGNPICLDWLRAKSDAPVKGVVLVIPGVGNYSQTPYIQRLVRRAAETGLHICVLSPRGMGSAPLVKPRLTCVTFTEDARTALKVCFSAEALRTRFDGSPPVFLLGYSAGATTVIKATVELFREWKAQPSLFPEGFPVKGIVSMNAPFNMFKHHDMIEHCAFYYQRPMTESMHKYAMKHAAVFIEGVHGLPVFKDKADLKKQMLHLKTANDFNEHMVAPHFNYAEGAKGYYKDAAAFKWLEQTDKSVPVVCLASVQDPITGVSHSDAEWQALTDAHPNVLFVETPVGGHLAYLPNPIDEFQEKGSFLIDFPLHVIRHSAEKTQKEKTA